MSHLNIRIIFLAVLAIVIASLSCVNMPGEAPPWVAVDEELQDISKNACDGTSYLLVTSEISKQETNQFGTRICEYRLIIKNGNQAEPVWFFVYQHDKDGFAHTEKSRWMGNVKLDPGAEGEWSGNIYIYTDKDADGPLMAIPEKIAGVLGSPECAAEKQDLNYFDQVSIPIDPVCPME